MGLNFWVKLQCQWARRILSAVMTEIVTGRSEFLCNTLEWCPWTAFTRREQFFFLQSIHCVRFDLRNSVVQNLQGAPTMGMYLADHFPSLHINQDLVKQIRLMWCLNSMAHIRTSNRVEMSPLLDSIGDTLKGYREA